MKRQSIIDHTGVEHKSIRAMAKYWNISYNTFSQRYYVWKWSLEDCLTKPNKNKYSNNGVYTDHKGNTFNTLKEMSEYWNINHKVVEERLNKLGWELEKALTKQVNKKK